MFNASFSEIPDSQGELDLHVVIFTIVSLLHEDVAVRSSFFFFDSVGNSDVFVLQSCNYW